tara:strand:+ start:768 stop:1214 length:447 start_codon:yes stop_codon:yes gene_type:complete
LNFLLSLNKKYILFFTFLISLLFLILFSFKYYTSNNNINLSNVVLSNADIIEPRFAINSINQKIFVTAKEGNFIDDNKILLKKNVVFKSNNFSIKTDNVMFNRLDQTATSNSKSFFKSKNTKISSEGFDIYDNGNKIKFNGNSIIIIK